jgi:hypothetical protein
MSEPSWLESLATQLMAIPAVGIALMGALGGATNALVGKVTPRRTIRYILLGGLCAAGSGQLSGTLLEYWGFIPEGMAAASSGAVAFFAGLFFPAVFEVILSRLRAGRLPMDGESK